MKIKHLILIAIILTNWFVGFGQVSNQECCNDKSVFVGLLSPNTDPSVYTAMQNIWYSNERISYLSIPKYNYLENPSIPLREGEGKNGYLFEGNIYHQAPILMGRNHGNHLWQTTRLTFDYGFNIRMATDSSNPLIPNNNIIGLTYDKILWDSYTGLNPLSHSLAHSFTDWNRFEQSLSTLSINLTGHHYSNGQPPGFFYRDTVNGTPRQRNDYLEGDFSTNYLQIGLTYSRMYPSRSIFSFKFAYQQDGNVFGPLNFSEEQIKSYGQKRLLGFLQYRFVWRNLSNRIATITNNCDTCILTRDVNLYRSYELLVRFDYEFILDDLSLYPHSNKYRFNPHLYVVYTKPNWRALGFVFHCYYGRDYSNIRYDLPVFAILGGISINFNKYRAPFSDRQKYHSF
jgi:hypothetical protein